MNLIAIITCILLVLCSHTSANTIKLITDPSVCLDDTECSSDTYCDHITSTCVPRVGLNEFCYVFIQSMCEQGLYCGDFVCEPLVPLGRKCFVSDACGPNGVCKDPTFGGKCQTVIGSVRSFYREKCESRQDCATIVDGVARPPARSPVECVTGVCRNPTELLKSLGKQCNPKTNLCDGRRGLLCKITGNKRRYVCQQKVTKEPVTNRYCTNDNRFSACFPQQGFPTVCIPNGIDAKEGFLECLRKPEIVSQGKLCGSDGTTVARCESGLSCEFNPEVAALRGRAYFSCVKTVGEGETCRNIFETNCGPGLFCNSGKCGKGTKPSFTAKFNGEGVRCAHRDCAQGLECEISSRTCMKPIQIVKKGGVCFATKQVRRVSYIFTIEFILTFVSFGLHSYDLYRLALGITIRFLTSSPFKRSAIPTGL